MATIVHLLQISPEDGEVVRVRMYWLPSQRVENSPFLDRVLS